MKIISTLFTVIFLTTGLLAQISDSPEAEIAKNLVIQSFEDIWSALDEEKIPLYHTDDFLLLEAGEEWTNETIANYQAKTKERGSVPTRTNRFEFIKVEHSGNMVWLAYHNYAHWTENGEDKGKAHWLESAVAIKTEKGWRLQMLHSTPVRNK